MWGEAMGCMGVLWGLGPPLCGVPEGHLGSESPLCGVSGGPWGSQGVIWGLRALYMGSMGVSGGHLGSGTPLYRG